MIPPCRLTASLPSRSHPHSESDLITKEEIACIISSLLSGKAAGHDHLCNKHLKFAPPVTASILTTIFNSILLSGHVPTSFEHGPSQKDGISIHQLCSRRKKAHLDIKKAFGMMASFSNFSCLASHSTFGPYCATGIVIAPLSPVLSLFTRGCTKVQSSPPYVLYRTFVKDLLMHLSSSGHAWCHSQWILLWSPHICR